MRAARLHRYQTRFLMLLLLQGVHSYATLWLLGEVQLLFGQGLLHSLSAAETVLRRCTASMMSACGSMAL